MRDKKWKQTKSILINRKERRRRIFYKIIYGQIPKYSLNKSDERIELDEMIVIESPIFKYNKENKMLIKLTLLKAEISSG